MYAACLESESSLVDESKDRLFAYSKSTHDERYLRELLFVAALCWKCVSMMSRNFIHC